MLETLRAYGAALLAEAGEQEKAAAALAGYALRVAERGRGGAGDQQRGAGRGPVAGCRGRHDAAGAGLGRGARPAGRAADSGRAGVVAVFARAAGGGIPAAARGCRARRGRQPGLVRRAVLAGLDGDVLRRFAHGDGPLHRAARRGRAPAAVAGTGRRLGGPGSDIAGIGPAPRGGRRRPPRAGRSPGGWLPGRGVAGPAAALPSRLAERRRGQRGAAGPARRTAPGGRHARRDSPDARRRAWPRR